MTREELRDELVSNIVEVLTDMSLDEEAEIMRVYCDSNNYIDDYPIEFDEAVFDDLCEGLKPSQIIDEYKDVDFSWDYVYMSIYGLEEWCGIPTTSSYDEIAEWIIDADNDCDNDKIADLLNEYNDKLDEMEEEDE